MPLTLTICGLLLAACAHPPVGGEPAFRLEPPEVTFTPPRGAADLTYAWDGLPPVPRPSADGAAIVVPWGESGLAHGTRLYRPFHEGSVAGRFGAGRALAAGETLALETGRLEGPWTVDFWIRPDSAPSGSAERVLHAPGAFELVRDREGHALLRIEGTTLRSGTPLEAGRWHHVGVVADGPELAALRLVVDGEARGRRREDGESTLERGLEAGGLACVVDDLRVLSRALTTDELAERHAPPLQPGEHVLSVRSGDALHEIKTWVGVVRQPVLENASDWRLGVRDHLAVRDGRLRWTEGQWRRDRPDLRPLARTTHPTVYLGNHRVFVYGGETRDTHVWPWANTDDTWIYRTDLATWRRVAVDGPAPSPRCHQFAAYSPDHGIVLYPGGWQNDVDEAPKFDDTWVFHVEEERWEERHPSGDPLPELANRATLYHPGLRRFLLLRRPRVFAYDPDADRWDAFPWPKVEFEAGPRFRYDPGSSPMIGHDPDTGNVILFGGAVRVNDENLFQDVTAHWDVEGNTIVVKDVGEAPSPRVRSAFAHDSKRGRFVLFGGVQDQRSVRNDDLWTYDPAEARWTRTDAADSPSRRGGFYGMAYDEDLDRFFVLCGRSAVDRFLNDAWRLHLAPEAEGRGTWVFDRDAFPELRHLACDVRLPGEATASFRFASSSDLAEWSAWARKPPAGRYLKVEVTVKPGGAEAPEVLALGFATEHGADPIGATRFAWTL